MHDLSMPCCIFLNPEETKNNSSCKNISPGIKQRTRIVVINILLVTPKLYKARGILCQMRSLAWEFIFHAPKSMYLASKEFELCPSITFTLSLQLCTVSYNQETKLKDLFLRQNFDLNCIQFSTNISPVCSKEV